MTMHVEHVSVQPKLTLTKCDHYILLTLLAM